MTDKIDLPERVVVGANGAYWRDYGDGYSMCPVSEDNDPVVPVAVYVAQPDVEALREVARAAEDALDVIDRATLPWDDTTTVYDCLAGESRVPMDALRAALDRLDR